MKSLFKKASIAVFAVGLGFSVRGAQAAAVVIGGGSSATVDGWTISAPSGVSLAVDGLNQVGNTLIIEKVANFTSPQGGYLITFDQSSSSAVPYIEFENESVTNSTGVGWNGFQFLLLNTTSSGASFSSQFLGATGTGVTLTPGALTSDALTYSGIQPAGSISNWGTSAAGDYILIDANPVSGASAGQVFGFKELPEFVPLPAAAWLGLAGLLALGTIASVKKLAKASA
jgi:hypothetical protein